MSLFNRKAGGSGMKKMNCNIFTFVFPQNILSWASKHVFPCNFYGLLCGETIYCIESLYEIIICTLTCSLRCSSRLKPFINVINEGKDVVRESINIKSQRQLCNLTKLSNFPVLS